MRHGQGDLGEGGGSLRTKERACRGDRLGEVVSGEMRVRRKWTQGDRGLGGVSSSSARCLQLHLSSKPSSSCQRNRVSGPHPELACRFKNTLKWMCSVY